MPRQIESRTLGPWHPDGHLNEIDDRLVRRWATGERSIPNWVFAALAEIVDVRAGKLNAFLIRLRKEANAPAIAVQALGDLIRASNRSNVQRSKDRAIELIGQISPLGDDGGPASRAARGTMDALMKLFNSIPDGNVEKCKQDALAAVDALKSKFQNATIKASAPDEPGGQPMSAPSDLDTCRRLLDEAAVSESTDFRADARRVAQRFRAALSAKDLALLRAELEGELARRRPAIIPAAQLTTHSRRVAVLEAALEVLSDTQADAYEARRILD